MDFIGVLKSTKTIIDYGFQLKGVSEESRNAKAVLEVVQGDLNELKRLANELKDVILSDQQRSIDDIIWRTNEVIALMAAPIKRSRKDVEEHGTVTIWRRITWTIKDGDTIKMYSGRLAVCQNSLNGQLVSLRAMQGSNGRGAHGSRPNVWEDESSLAPNSAIVTDDLNDEGGLWADWLSDEGGKRQRKRKRKRSSTSRQPRPSPKLLASSHPRKNEQEQDFSWLREHTEAELDGRSPTLHIPPVSEHPSDDDISWLADPFNIAEEDDRENRSASRH